MKKSKYHNKKITVNGETFDSLKEYRRYCELCLLERAGEISELRRQVKYELIPTQREPDAVGVRGGVKQGKVIERSCCYIADFVYVENGVMVVEDTKGVKIKTDAYKIKKKLMLKLYGIKIRES